MRLSRTRPSASEQAALGRQTNSGLRSSLIPHKPFAFESTRDQPTATPVILRVASSFCRKQKRFYGDEPAAAIAAQHERPESKWASDFHAVPVAAPATVAANTLNRQTPKCLARRRRIGEASFVASHANEGSSRRFASTTARSGIGSRPTQRWKSTLSSIEREGLVDGYAPASWRPRAV